MIINWKEALCSLVQVIASLFLLCLGQLSLANRLPGGSFLRLCFSLPLITAIGCNSCTGASLHALLFALLYYAAFSEGRIERKIHLQVALVSLWYLWFHTSKISKLLILQYQSFQHLPQIQTLVLFLLPSFSRYPPKKRIIPWSPSTWQTVNPLQKVAKYRPTGAY